APLAPVLPPFPSTPWGRRWPRSGRMRGSLINLKKKASAMPTPSFRLEADWNPKAATPGRLAITLINTGNAPVSGFTLAVTSLFRIKPESPVKGARLLDQLSNYHVLAPAQGFVLERGGRWEIIAEEI